MWTLVQTVAGDDGVKLEFWLCTGRTYVVGRKEGECDIRVDGDRSISRGHAQVLVAEHTSIKNRTERPEVSIVDTSTYGTIVEGVQAEKSKQYPLREGCEVQFGVFKSIFKLVWLDITLCLSKTSAETKKKLRADILNIGAYITMGLDDATHVVTDTVMPTLICFGALAKGVPIVSAEWVSLVASRTSPRTPLPDPGLHLPPPADIWRAIPPPSPAHSFANELFRVNPLRRSLFDKKFFVFLEDQCFQANRELVGLCGAMAFNESSSDLVNSKSAREAFFIRHHSHYLVVSSLASIRPPPGAPPTQLSEGSIDLKYKASVAEQLGFILIEQSNIIAAMLWASTDAFRSIRFPTRPPQHAPSQPAGMRGSTALTQAKSSVTHIGTLGSLQENHTDTAVPPSLTHDDVLGGLPDGGGADGGATPPPAELKREIKQEVLGTPCGGGEGGSPGGVGEGRTATVPQSPPQSTPSRRRKRRVDPESDSESEDGGDPGRSAIDAFFGGRARSGGHAASAGSAGGAGGAAATAAADTHPRRTQRNVRARVEGGGEAVPAAEPAAAVAAPSPAAEGDGGLGSAALSGCVQTESVRLVSNFAKDAAVFLDTAFPCYQSPAAGAAVPGRRGGGARPTQKSFVKQHLRGGMRQGLDGAVRLEAFQPAPMVPLMADDAAAGDAAFEDLITTATWGKKRASRRGYAADVSSFASAIVKSGGGGGGGGASRSRGRSGITVTDQRSNAMANALIRTIINKDEMPSSEDED